MFIFDRKADITGQLKDFGATFKIATPLRDKALDAKGAVVTGLIGPAWISIQSITMPSPCTEFSVLLQTNCSFLGADLFVLNSLTNSFAHGYASIDGYWRFRLLGDSLLTRIKKENVISTVVWSWKSGEPQRIYDHGHLVAESAVVSGSITSPVASIYPGLGILGEINLFGVSSVRLTDALLRELSLDPWGVVLEPPRRSRRPIWIPSAGVADGYTRPTILTSRAAVTRASRW